MRVQRCGTAIFVLGELGLTKSCRHERRAAVNTPVQIGERVAKRRQLDECAHLCMYACVVNPRKRARLTNYIRSKSA